MTEITQESQDKFRAAIINKIKQHFPDTEIKSPIVISGERHIALAVNMQEMQRQDWKLDCFPMEHRGSGDSIDDAIQEALNDIRKIRFMS